MPISNIILDQLVAMKNKRYRLCLLVNFNPHLSSNLPILSEVPFINIGQQLSEKLIILSKQERSAQASIIFREIIHSSSIEFIGLSRLEILFDRELAIDPLKLLCENAKEKTLLALWPGYFDSKIGLTYAQPSHSEYRFYKPSDISDVLIINLALQKF